MLRIRFQQALRVVALATLMGWGGPMAGWADDGSAGRVDPGTAAMAERLRRLAAQADPVRNPFRNRERASALGNGLRGTTNLAVVAQYAPLLAAELLQAGRSDAALRQYGLVEKLYRLHPQLEPPGNGRLIQLGRAVAALRLGEQENCIINHTAESCLFPLQPGGFHQLPRGSRTAIPILARLADADPADLAIRWLLNVAHMTLGEWPDGVPAAHRIDPARFASPVPFPAFAEVAGRVGLDADDLAGGVAVGDFDRDGYPDLMVSAWGHDGPLRLYRATGDGGFEERAVAAGLAGITGGLNLVAADYDNDGWEDVLVLRGAWLGSEGRLPNSLLRNRGDGTFADVTEAAGLLTFHPTQTAAWFDFDGDGWLDLFVGNESQEGDVHPCELFRNNGDGTFTDWALPAGVAVRGFVKGVVAGDYDRDGRPDLYLSLRDAPNQLLHNDGPAPGHTPSAPRWRFSDRAAAAGVQEPRFSFPAMFLDYDQDGWPDLFVAGYRIRHVGDIVADYLGLPHDGTRARLYRNRGDGTFADVSAEAGVDRVLHAMGVNFGDLDSDGYPDIYLATGDPDLLTLVPNVMLWNEGGRRYRDVTSAGRFGHLQKGHGVAFADLDNDGDQDVYANMGGAYSGDNYRNILFLNPGFTNRWLRIELEGRTANRSAIGAHVAVTVETASGDRTIHRWIGTGGSFGSNPLRAEIGLGSARSIRRVEIDWPAPGGRQRLVGLEPDRSYRVVEGAADAEAVPVRSVPLRLDREHPHRGVGGGGG